MKYADHEQDKHGRPFIHKHGEHEVLKMVLFDHKSWFREVFLNQHPKNHFQIQINSCSARLSTVDFFTLSKKNAREIPLKLLAFSVQFDRKKLP